MFIRELVGTVEKAVKVCRAGVMEEMKVRSLAELARLIERAGVRESNRQSVIRGE